VIVNGGKSPSFPVLLHMGNFMDYVEQTDPALYKLEKFVDSDHRKNFESEVRRWAGIRENAKKNTSEAKSIKKMADDLGSYMPGIKEATIKSRTLCEELEKAMTEIVTKLYPELLESKPQYIEKLGEVVVDNILRFSREINDLSYDALKDA